MRCHNKNSSHVVVTLSQDAGACRFLAVCARCSTDCKGESSGVRVVVAGGPAAVPVCDEVPTGARSAEDGGTTLETLELEPGYYRTSNKSHNVLECFQEAACKGGVDAAGDGYCAEGYSGPCESLSVFVSFVKVRCLAGTACCIVQGLRNKCIPTRWWIWRQGRCLSIFLGKTCFIPNELTTERRGDTCVGEYLHHL